MSKINKFLNMSELKGEYKARVDSLREEWDHAFDTTFSLSAKDPDFGYLLNRIKNLAKERQEAFKVSRQMFNNLPASDYKMLAKSLKIFLLSVSLVVAQLWLIVVFCISPFAWALLRPCLRDRVLTHLNPWLIVVCGLRIIVRYVFFQLKMLSKSSKRYSRRTDMTVVH